MPLQIYQRYIIAHIQALPAPDGRKESLYAKHLFLNTFIPVVVFDACNREVLKR